MTILLSDYACPKLHDNLTDVSPDQHHNQQHLFYGPDHTDVNTQATLVSGATPVYSEALGQWAALNVFVATGYGGIKQTVSPLALPDLGAGFEVVPADAGVVTAPRGVTQDFASDGIAVNLEGVWTANIIVSLEHNEDQGGRSIEVHIYDLTTDTPGLGTSVPIGRNSPGTLISVSLMVEIAPADIGNVFQIRIGGGDIVTAVELLTYQFSISHASEWKVT